jgi:hypothetical protein
MLSTERKLHWNCCVVILMCVFLISCISGNSNITQPSEYPLQIKSVLIEKPKEEVWDTLLANVTNSFFVVNNIEKVSGFINLSYAGPPCNYVDCGWITSEVTAGRTRTYSFPGCSEYQQYEFYDQIARVVWNYQRTMKLEGRINILVQEEQPSRTRVSTNIRYAVNKILNIYPMNRTLNDTIQFDTGGYAGFPGPTNLMSSCRPNHKLEADVLKMVTGSK